MRIALQINVLSGPAYGTVMHLQGSKNTELHQVESLKTTLSKLAGQLKCYE